MNDRLFLVASCRTMISQQICCYMHSSVLRATMAFTRSPIHQSHKLQWQCSWHHYCKCNLFDASSPLSVKAALNFAGSISLMSYFWHLLRLPILTWTCSSKIDKLTINEYFVSDLGHLAGDGYHQGSCQAWHCNLQHYPLANSILLCAVWSVDAPPSWQHGLLWSQRQAPLHHIILVVIFLGVHQGRGSE